MKWGIFVVALTVVTAGCIAVQQPEEDVTSELPPGVSSDGIENWNKLVENHRNITDGKATSLLSESLVNDRTKTTEYVLNRNTSTDGDVYMKAAEIQDGSKTEVEVWNSTDERRLFVKVTEEGQERFLQSGGAHPYSRLVSTDKEHVFRTLDGVEKYNQTVEKMEGMPENSDVWRIKILLPAEPTVVEGELTNKDGVLKVFVNRSGYIHRIDLSEGYHIDGKLAKGVDTNYRFEMRESVEKPGWVSDQER
ncbi:MAG: hypothetical protein ABEK59_08965 [Halobacteria archaeon]